MNQRTLSFCSMIAKILSIPILTPTHATSRPVGSNMPTSLSYRPPPATDPTPPDIISSEPTPVAAASSELTMPSFTAPFASPPSMSVIPAFAYPKTACLLYPHQKWRIKISLLTFDDGFVDRSSIIVQSTSQTGIENHDIVHTESLSKTE